MISFIYLQMLISCQNGRRENGLKVMEKVF